MLKKLSYDLCTLCLCSRFKIQIPLFIVTPMLLMLVLGDADAGADVDLEVWEMQSRDE